MRRSGDVLGPVREGTLGEPNDRLTARLADKDAANAERTGLGRMLSAIAAEEEEFARRSERKGVCPECFMVRPCGISRKAHQCDDDAALDRAAALAARWKAQEDSEIKH